MKIKEKNEARRLRKSIMSLGDIAKKLNVAKSSVSSWTRDIELTEEQHNKIWKRGHLRQNADFMSERARDKRRKSQEEGKKKAKEKNSLHLSGCMLYWAEGWKSNNKSVISFSNSDPNMIRVFMSFLEKEMNIDKNDLKLVVNCYLGNGLTQEKIEEYWLNLTGASKENLRKTQVNRLPSSSKGYKKNKLKYGTCHLIIYNTQKMQEIYGAIQEYGNFIEEKWLG